MKRCLFAAAAVSAVVLAFACKTSTGTPPPAVGDDGGSADATSCPCEIKDDAGTTYTVACGSIGCAGTREYLCEEGLPALQGPCVPPMSDVCVPSCPTGSCNISDSCGGRCKCPSGDTCVLTQCSSNGCLQSLGDYCGVNPEAGAAECCASGYKCPAIGEGGTPTCCALTNEGDCTSDSDCCDYPAVKCTPLTSDAGTIIGHRCM